MTSITINRKQLFIAASKALVDAGTGAPVATVAGLMLDGWGATEKKPVSAAMTADEAAAAIMKRSLARAVAQAIRHFGLTQHKRRAAGPDIYEGREAAEEISLEIASILEGGSGPWLDDLMAEIEAWVRVIDISDDEVSAIRQYIKEEIPISIQSELRENRKVYAEFLASVQATVADAAASEARAWRAYRVLLIGQTREPLFSLDPEKPQVSLEDVFIPLRVSCTRREVLLEGGASTGLPEAAGKREVLWLETVVTDWIAAADATDPIKFITGEPGSGKSSFAKMYSAALARAGRRVLYIPLHRINFHGDAKESISNFATAKDNLGFDPLKSLADTDPMILIFDGLDELSKADDVTGDAVRGFIENLDRNVRILNNGIPRLLCLVAGRPLVTARVSFDYREPQQKLEVLRYWPVSGDDSAIGKLDQRDEWWAKFGSATGLGYEGVPAVFLHRGRQVDEITSQPLLNYLLAQVTDRVESGSTVSGVHDLYRIIFEEVRKSPHRDPSRPKEITSRLQTSDYDVCLEEVAVVAWKTGDRAVKIGDLREHFQKDETLAAMMDVFDDMQAGLYAILDTFYVAPESGNPSSFEFTHKSFREYLTARRIVRLVADISGEYAANPRRFKVRNALREWASLFLDVSIDNDLLLFLRAELINSFWPLKLEDCHGCLTALMQENIRWGMPVDLWGGVGSRLLNSRSKKAEVALIQVLGLISQHVAKPITIEWPGLTAAQEMFIRILTPTFGYSLSDHLALPFDWYDFNGQLLFNVAVQNCSFVNASFDRARLRGANFVHADLSKASFRDADLQDVNVRNARMKDADVTGANLQGMFMWDSDVANFPLSRRALLARKAVVEVGRVRKTAKPIGKGKNRKAPS